MWIGAFSTVYHLLVWTIQYNVVERIWQYIKGIWLCTYVGQWFEIKNARKVFKNKPDTINWRKLGKFLAYNDRMQTHIYRDEMLNIVKECKKREQEKFPNEVIE